VDAGGVYLNNVRIAADQKSIGSGDVIWPNAMLLRAGKKNYHLVLVD
jgi:hypothetical protein